MKKKKSSLVKNILIGIVDVILIALFFGIFWQNKIALVMVSIVIITVGLLIWWSNKNS
jgi:hypothetical protein